MSKKSPKKPLPAICRFKPRDLAYVRLGGRRHYLGKYGSPESFAAYGRLCAEITAGVQQLCLVRDAAVSVNVLIDQFRQWAEKRYQKAGKQTSEISSFKACLRPIRELYGLTPADEFGPARLLAIRTKLVDAGICRKRVNQHLYRIRRVWKWGVSRELVKESTWRALQSVEGLRHGEAYQPPKVTAATYEQLQSIEQHVSRQVWALLQFIWLTGARPGEAVLLRGREIDRS